MILAKSSVLLDEEHYSQILNLSWELLLDRNEELAACAGKINRNPSHSTMLTIDCFLFSNNRYSHSSSGWSFDRCSLPFRNAKFVRSGSIQCYSEISISVAFSLSILDSTRRRCTFHDEGRCTTSNDSQRLKTMRVSFRFFHRV